MEARDIPLLDIHSALSALSLAVKLEIEVPADVTVEWREGTHLAVRIEVRKKNKQLVIDRLSRGAIHGPYDYRFSLSYSTSDESDWQTVMAYVDLHHPKIRKAA